MEENWQVEALQETSTAEERRATAKARLGVWGLGCPNCAARVRNRLISLTGVIDAEVDHRLGIAEVIFNPDLVQAEALVDAVFQAGRGRGQVYLAQLWGLSYGEAPGSPLGLAMAGQICQRESIRP